MVLTNEEITTNFLALGEKDRAVIIYIYELGNPVKPGDIAKKLFLPHSTVNSVIKRLVAKKMVIWEEYFYVKITPIARKMAAHNLKHHIIIHHFFQKVLDLSDKDAHDEGLKIAGVISCQTVLQMQSKIINCDLAPCKIFV